MVIDNFHFQGVAAIPQKTDSPLIIDANIVLTPTVTSQDFEPIAWRDAQIAKSLARARS